jgi:broad specificity phosphatase PhoE
VATRVILARHGETDWNVEQRWQGHADRPLNERGRLQARRLAEDLAGEPIAAVYTSDLSRARETAEIVAHGHGMPARPLAALREIDVGEWEGFTWPELEARFPEGVARHHETGRGWERGEDFDDMSERVVAAVREIAAWHPDETVLVVGHGGTLRSVLAHSDGVDFAESRRRIGSLENCACFAFAVENGTIRRLD